MLPRFEPQTEYVVPADVTAAQLTSYMDKLVEEQVVQLAAMYRALIADLKARSEEIKRTTRDAWLTKDRPAALAGEPEAIRQRLEALPERPPFTDWIDSVEERSPDRTRGVYLRLTSGCYRNADMRSYDKHGDMVDRVFVIDDPLARLGAAQFLWSELDRRDRLPRRAGGRRRRPR
jgi:hypothetical protein